MYPEGYIIEHVERDPTSSVQS